MPFAAWYTLTVVVLAFLALRRRGLSPDLVFLGALVLLTLPPFQVISLKQAISGFANPAVIMVGALFVVAAGMRSTGALDYVGNKVLGSAENEYSALVRLSLPVAGLSAFINNTPIVAMLVPMVLQWCRKRQISPSRLLLPFSYLAILGGTCTLIGTSTNLVINGLLSRKHAELVARADSSQAGLTEQLQEMGFVEIGAVGLPCTVVGLAYLLLVGRWRLPNRTELIEKLGDERREYLVEMLVEPDCPLIGQSVEQAGLRHLPGLFLIEIDRNGEIFGPVTPEDVVHAGDRLVFTGVVTTIVDLEKIPGLRPAADLTYELDPRTRSRRHLTEAVISKSSPLVGKTIREANFRQLYGAAVVAVHRNGQRVPNKIGDIRLEPGDTLLLQTQAHFEETFRNDPHFYLVSSVEGSQPGRSDKVWLSFSLLGLLVVFLLGTGLAWPQAASTNLPTALALAVAVLMIFTRCLSMAEARSAIDLQVLITIAAALGLGAAMDESGAVKAIAETVIGGVGSNPYVLLAVILVTTLIFTEMVTNNAVAALMFPLAVEVAVQGGFSPRPLVMAIALAASCSFITPVGYQTNLMVLGPGGYQPGDYLRAGWPLSLLVLLTAMLVIPLAWPF